MDCSLTVINILSEGGGQYFKVGYEKLDVINYQLLLSFTLIYVHGRCVSM